jgi:hypothetical protein
MLENLAIDTGHLTPDIHILIVLICQFLEGGWNVPSYKGITLTRGGSHIQLAYEKLGIYYYDTLDRQASTFHRLYPVTLFLKQSNFSSQSGYQIGAESQPPILLFLYPTHHWIATAVMFTFLF